jgi:hypothetical protein
VTGSSLHNRARANTFFRGIGFRAAALVLSFAVACGAGEIGLRLAGYSRTYLNPFGSFHEYDPVLGCRGKPDFVGRFRQADFDVVVAHNGLGFRQPEVHPQVVEPDHTLFVLGDSFVWGYGVGQAEVITDQIAMRLPEYRVRNFGLAGSGTVEQMSIFDRHVRDQLDPGDIVILTFLGNDFRDNVGRILQGRLYATIEGGNIREVPPAPRSSSTARFKDKLKDVSYLFNLVSYSCDRAKQWWTAPLKTGPRREPPSEIVLTDAAADADAETITQHYLAKLESACWQNGAHLLVAYIPGQAELGEDDVTATEDLSRAQQQACRSAFFRIAESLELETIDLLPSFLTAKQSSNEGRLTFKHDFHWNPRGHFLAASVICDRIHAATSVARAVDAPEASAR